MSTLFDTRANKPVEPGLPGLLPEDVEAYCRGHGCRFFSMGTRLDATNPQFFLGVTLNDAARVLSFSFDAVRHCKQAGTLQAEAGESRRYRHYKGGLYVSLTVALDVQTLEPVMVYRSEDTGKVWVRDLAEFHSLLTPPGSTQLVPRFADLGPLR